MEQRGAPGPSLRDICTTTRHTLIKIRLMMLQQQLQQEEPLQRCTEVQQQQVQPLLLLLQGQPRKHPALC